MKRNMDLVREIMLWLEEHHHGQPKIPERDRQEIGYHCHLLMQAGLIDGVVSTYTDDKLPQAIPSSITWRGHEFIDAARDASIWKAAKEKVLGPAGGVAFTVLLEWMKEEAKRRLGIPSA